MQAGISGYRNGEPWPTVGGVIDVPDHEAADLISQHYATEATRDEIAAHNSRTATSEQDAGTGDEPDADKPAEPRRVRK
jgi:hypothetical protein